MEQGRGSTAAFPHLALIEAAARYTERGIKQIDGFMSERWRIEPGYFTKVDPSLGLLDR